MKHVRDATHGYTTTHHDVAPTATLALRLNRLATPTLLPPSQNGRITDCGDNSDLSSVYQPNGFLKSPSRYFLAGLGIHCELESTDVPQFSENNRSSGAYDGEYLVSAGTVFQPRDHSARRLTCASDSCGSLGFIGNNSSPDLMYPSFSSSASLSSTASVSDNEGAQPSTAISLPFYEDDVFPRPLPSIGLIPDVNMYNLALLTKEPSVGVDPLDTMGRVIWSPRTVLPSSEVTLPSRFSAANYESPPYNPSSDPTTHDEVGGSAPPPLSQNFLSLDDLTTIHGLSTFDIEVSDETFMRYAHGGQSSFERCTPLQGARVSPVIKIKSDDLMTSPTPKKSCIARKSDTFSFPSDGTFPPRQIKTEHNDFAQDELYLYPSPVLNAHVGVELSELTFRAQRYRRRHPGQSIDRAWLMSFAGKLTKHGELIDDYRCYVVGCSQRNKRRDHIIIHIGAHVDQRPFSCAMCSRRFLRKNECNRHEATHTGVRPYRCGLCGHSFVRQDLLTRHIQRVHGLETRSRRKKTQG